MRPPEREAAQRERDGAAAEDAQTGKSRGFGRFFSFYHDTKTAFHFPPQVKKNDEHRRSKNPERNL